MQYQLEYNSSLLGWRGHSAIHMDTFRQIINGYFHESRFFRRGRFRLAIDAGLDYIYLDDVSDRSFTLKIES